MTCPIVLAFSGGLDTSFCIPWLRETTGRGVVAVTVNTGGLDAAAGEALADRARALGATGNYLEEEPFCTYQPNPRAPRELVNVEGLLAQATSHESREDTLPPRGSIPPAF
jgi:PP-loop superfamily ATP-utilizing enzyme